MELDNNIEKEGVDYNKISKLKILDKNTTCAICFDNFKKEDSFRELKCKHEFCEECLIDWCSENKKCPICMIEL